MRFPKISSSSEEVPPKVALQNDEPMLAPSKGEIAPGETEMLKEKQIKTSPSPPEECSGCGGKIQDRYFLLTMDRQWHSSCLRCCACKVTLEAELSCYSKDGNIYCKDDYYRLFVVKRCARCSCCISSNELVMKARELVYHLACFTCAACGCPLPTGDVFGIRDDLVYCRTHYDNIAMHEYYEDDYNVMFGCGDAAEEAPNGSYESPGPSQKGRPRKRKLQGTSDDIQIQTMRMASSALEILHRGELTSSMESLAYDSSVTSPGSVTGHSARTKRMRTSFKHHQLRTMKSYFAINQNPDAKDLKQLAQKTGLSKRVLQVWFQNARAKWRRNIMRQETNGNNSGQGSTTQQMIINDAQSMEELRILTPRPHALNFNELY